MTIDYRLAPRHRWPAQIHDVKAAVRWLRAMRGSSIDPEKIGAMGVSAGGHLAQFLDVTNDVREFDGDAAPCPFEPRVVHRRLGPGQRLHPGVRRLEGAAEAFRGFLGAELTADSRGSTSARGRCSG